jgi:hypothetical protein
MSDFRQGRWELGASNSEDFSDWRRKPFEQPAVPGGRIGTDNKDRLARHTRPPGESWIRNHRYHDPARLNRGGDRPFKRGFSTAYNDFMWRIDYYSSPFGEGERNADDSIARRIG